MLSLLEKKRIPKPWGRYDLPHPFEGAPSEKIGEIWFDDAGTQQDLLVKYLFTSEKLSIQVHPSDQLARQSGLPSGKEECWIVIDAEPGAVLGIGTKVPLSPEDLRIAAIDGSIEQLMDWMPVSRGDLFYIPPGTVHAIGGGVSIIEVQQNADITYRLYDYGRPRDLHLDDGIKAAIAKPYEEHMHSRIDLACEEHIFDGPKFALWTISDWPADLLSGEPVQLIPLRGQVSIAGITAQAGDCLLCPPFVALERSSGFMALMAQAKSLKSGQSD
mgnify:CR=1 FL=1